MATTTHISAPSATPSSVVTVGPEADASPLLKLIPYAYTAFSLLVSFLSFSSVIFKLVLYPLPVISYIIAPITIFIDVVLTIFIRVPYRTFLYVADAFYPVYVLLGVACITGCLFGYCGRILTRFLLNLFPDGQDVGPLMGVGARRSLKDLRSRGRQEVKFEE